MDTVSLEDRPKTRPDNSDVRPVACDGDLHANTQADQSPPDEKNPVAGDRANSGSPINWRDELPLLRCVWCGGSLEMTDAPGGNNAESDDITAALTCTACAKTFPIRGEILEVMDDLKGNNRIAADFYNGPLWPKFRFWEFFTFFLNGGIKRSRRQILRHLPEDLAGMRMLEVAIGDGSNLPFIDERCEMYGVDISTVQLDDLARQFPDRGVRRILGEAERLPFADDTFDNVLSVGAINYFSDPIESMREMARVCKPDGLVIVSDEYPGLPNRMLFRWIGLPQVDRWIMSRLMKLGPDFTKMVDEHRNMKLQPMLDVALTDWTMHSLWMKTGYCAYGRPRKED